MEWKKKISAHISIFVPFSFVDIIWLFHLCVVLGVCTVSNTADSFEWQITPTASNENNNKNIHTHTHTNRVMCQFQTKKMRCVRFSQANWSIVRIKANRSAAVYGTEFFFLCIPYCQSVRLLLMLVFSSRNYVTKAKNIVLDILFCVCVLFNETLSINSMTLYGTIRCSLMPKHTMWKCMEL